MTIPERGRFWGGSVVLIRRRLSWRLPSLAAEWRLSSRYWRLLPPGAGRAPHPDARP